MCFAKSNPGFHTEPCLGDFHPLATVFPEAKILYESLTKYFNVALYLHYDAL